MKQSILAMAVAAILTGGASAATTQAEVNEALRGNPDIYNGLFTAALIYHVARTCPDIRGPNRLTRASYLLSLYNRARSMGFSRSQIEAFVEDDVEKARMQELVDRHLQRAGVADPYSEADICAFARTQMAEGTMIGRQLTER